MTFDELNDVDLLRIQRELEQKVHERGLAFGKIAVKQSAETGSIEATALVLSDPFLESAPYAVHHRILVEVTMFIESQETDRQVLWGRIWYSVEREHSYFFPVPKEYGDHVTIHFNWEFDRETLQHGVGEVRDRDSVHFVSVLPNEQLKGFVECCSDVAERWIVDFREGNVMPDHANKPTEAEAFFSTSDALHDGIGATAGGSGSSAGAL